MIVPGVWKDMNPANNVFKENWGFLGARYMMLQEDESGITFEEELRARMISHFYVGKEGVDREHKQGLIDMFTDAYFASPNNEIVKLHAQSPPPVYNYLFSYNGSFSLSSIFAMG